MRSRRGSTSLMGHLLAEQTSETLEPGPNPALHRALRLPEELRDLLIGVAAVVRGHEWDALGVRELQERVAHVSPRGGQPTVDVARSHQGLTAGVVLLLAPGSGAVRSEQVDGAGVGDGEEEAAQGAAGRIEPVGLLPDAQEDRLGNLFGPRMVA